MSRNIKMHYMEHVQFKKLQVCHIYKCTFLEERKNGEGGNFLLFCLFNLYYFERWLKWTEKPKKKNSVLRYFTKFFLSPSFPKRNPQQATLELSGLLEWDNAFPLFLSHIPRNIVMLLLSHMGEELLKIFRVTLGGGI